MINTELLVSNLLSPIVMAFALGVVASLLRSDLEVPAPMHKAMSLYLLFAIGLKGGVALSNLQFSTLLLPVLVTIVAGVLTTVAAYFALRTWVGLRVIDAAAVAAHYGSVSAVTFIAARELALQVYGKVDDVLVALVVVLEIPAILIGLLLGQRQSQGGERLWHTLREVLTGRTVILLGGGLVIGTVAGTDGSARITPFFFTLFEGVLVLFLLDLGMAAAKRLGDVREVGWRFVVFSMLVPLAHGALGVGVGTWLGFGPGGAAVFGAMLASASYIAAPAAVRMGLPEANPSLYLTAALGLTFPFNLAIGIPLYLALAETLT
jgi:uncharacterized protein